MFVRLMCTLQSTEHSRFDYIEPNHVSVEDLLSFLMDSNP